VATPRRADRAPREGDPAEPVIAQLVSRIRREEGDLASRKACPRHTHDDEQVMVGLRALARAICWFQEAREAPPRPGRRSGHPYAGADVTSRIASEAENPSTPRARASSR